MPFNMDGGFISMMISMLAFIGVSYLEKPKPMPKDIQAILDI